MSDSASDSVSQKTLPIWQIHVDILEALRLGNRIAILKLELKGKEKVSDVKMGAYEQDVGLKMKGKSSLS